MRFPAQFSAVLVPCWLLVTAACAQVFTPAPMVSPASFVDPGSAGGAPSSATKKGLCIVARPDGVYASRVRALNAKWFYSWGGNLPPDVPFGVEFVPMVWGWYDGPKQLELMHGLGDGVKAQRFTTLLGFNEPDGKDQANLSVEKALDAWPQLAVTGARLGSPAAVHADGPWMREFMKGVQERKLRVDFVTIHWYGDPSAGGFLGYVEAIHKLYQKPVWITEFCPADWSADSKPNRFNERQVQDFMRAVVPALQGRGYVERFAWYSPRAEDKVMGYSALFKDDGSLTELGKIYAGF